MSTPPRAWLFLQSTQATIAALLPPRWPEGRRGVSTSFLFVRRPDSTPYQCCERPHDATAHRSCPPTPKLSTVFRGPGHLVDRHVDAACGDELVLTNVIAVWHLVLLSLFLGIVNAFDTPIRQSLIVDMIESREDLGNAIALNSSMVNGARLVGPSIAGILIASVGEGMCFLLNAVSYVAVIAALMAMTIAAKKMRAQRPHIWEAWREGVTYAFGSPLIRSVLVLLGVVSFMGMPYATLLPIFAQEVLHGGAQTLGFLMGAAGIGALIGAMFLASRNSMLGLETVLVVAAMIFGTGLIGFSLSRIFWLSCGLMIVSGFGMMVHMAAANT